MPALKNHNREGFLKMEMSENNITYMLIWKKLSITIKYLKLDLYFLILGKLEMQPNSAQDTLWIFSLDFDTASG